MSNDNKDSEAVICDSLVRETVMPPYEYQKPQFGFGMIINDQPSAKENPFKDRPTTTKSE